MNTTCIKCGKNFDKSKICVVDGNTICVECMYGGTEPVVIYPIGIVKNTQERNRERFGIKNKNAVSEIVLLESQKPFMYKLEEESLITVIYYLHKSEPVRSVFNRGLDGKRVGVFASRTPDRLSKLAIQDVRLKKIDGTTLYVEGLDAINGSPVLDIKLYWKNPDI